MNIMSNAYRKSTCTLFTSFSLTPLVKIKNEMLKYCLTKTLDQNLAELKWFFICSM
jgi:hypothetical protein